MPKKSEVIITDETQELENTEIKTADDISALEKLETEMFDLALMLCKDAKEHRTIPPDELKRMDTIISLHQALKTDSSIK